MKNWKERLDFPEDALEAQKVGHSSRAIQARASFSRIVGRAQYDPQYKGVPGVVSGTEINRWMDTAGRNSHKKVERDLLKYCARQHGTTAKQVENVMDDGWLP